MTLRSFLSRYFSFAAPAASPPQFTTPAPEPEENDLMPDSQAQTDPVAAPPLPVAFPPAVPVQAAADKLVALAEPELLIEVSHLSNPFISVAFEMLWPFLKPILTNVLVRIAGKVLPKPAPAAPVSA